MRVVVGVLGAATLVVGVVLLFNPVAAAHTLALLIGLAFVVGGLLEIAAGWDSGRRWASFVLGAILVIGGILAAVVAERHLVTVALITGLSLIVHGAARVGIAVVLRHEIPCWGWLALAGAVNVVVGVVAIAWPQATVLVLSLILGLQIDGLRPAAARRAPSSPDRVPDHRRPRSDRHSPSQEVDMPLLRGIARTAVVAGTATAVSNRVSRRQANRWANQQAGAGAGSRNRRPPQAPPPGPTRTPSSPSCASWASCGTPACWTTAEFELQKSQILNS